MVPSILYWTAILRRKLIIPTANSYKNQEESVSTSDAGTNLQKGNLDEESSASFVTVEEKDTGFSS